MSVSIARRAVSDVTGLSEPGRAVLALIEGGVPWLEWAIREPVVRYHFENERALVAEVQNALHASPFLLLARLGLMVSPAKLMTLSLADLLVLAEAEADASDATPGAARVKQVLDEAGLVTAADLAAIEPFLVGLGVAGAPVFQAMGLAERLALLNLSASGQTLDRRFQAEAAAFAVARGRTPLEFAEYYQIYLRLIATTATPAEREASVEAALDILRPLIFGALDCPNVQGDVEPWHVSEAIYEWLRMGRKVGFARPSLGMQQVVANEDFGQHVESDAGQIVEAYLAGAQKLLLSAELGPGLVGQDGSCRFEISRKGAQAVVHLGVDNMISLVSYRPAAATNQAESEVGRADRR